MAATVKDLNKELLQKDMFLATVFTENFSEELTDSNTLYHVLKQTGFDQYKAPDKARESEKFTLELSGYDVGIIVQALMLHHKILWQIYGNSIVEKLKKATSALGRMGKTG